MEIRGYNIAKTSSRFFLKLLEIYKLSINNNNWETKKKNTIIKDLLLFFIC